MSARYSELEFAELTLRPTLRTLSFDLPIKTVSEANQRDHWRVKSERRKAQQLATTVILRNELRGRKFVLPCTVKLTRIGPKKLDSDNLAGSFKACRDAIARTLGIDDGDERITFVYDQQPIGERSYNIKVLITSP